MSTEARCQEGGCKSFDAQPQFTAPLDTITRKEETRQPKWFCIDHRGKHPRVSALTGRDREDPVKSYEVRKGTLVPLGKRDQYEEYWRQRSA